MKKFHVHFSPQAILILCFIVFFELVLLGFYLSKKVPESPVVSPVKREEPPSNRANLPVANRHIDAPPPRSVEEILSSVSLPQNKLKKKDKKPTVYISPSPTTVGSISKEPLIRNPRVELLIKQARLLSMDGDRVQALVKLEEAQRLDAQELAVLYQKASLFEEMGLFIKASAIYQKIQSMGALHAGYYFQKASQKLTEGMKTKIWNFKRMRIGFVSQKKTPEGTMLRIPLQARPEEVIVPADVHVQIHFYDQVNGKDIVKAHWDAVIQSSWENQPADWNNADNIEELQVSYQIASRNHTENYLLGKRCYYGYVVELLYKNDVIDQVAFPRHLHHVHGQARQIRLPNGWDELEHDGAGDSLLPDKNLELPE